MTLSPSLPDVNYTTNKKPPIPHRPFSDPNRLAPEDAFCSSSHQYRQQPVGGFNGRDGEIISAGNGTVKVIGSARRRRGKERDRSRSRRGRGVWKKLLWVKQKDCRVIQSINLFVT